MFRQAQHEKEFQLILNMNLFLSRFKEKTRKELESILNNRESYTPEAIEAARVLLKNETYKEEGKQEWYGKNKVKQKKRNGIDDISAFINSFSAYDLVTYLALTLSYWSIFEFASLYNGERIYNQLFGPMLIVLLPIVFVINHVFHKIEKKQNTFLGRVVNTSFLIVIMILFRILFQVLIQSTTVYEFDLTGSILIILFLLVCVFVFELFISLINLFLLKLKCPLL